MKHKAVELLSKIEFALNTENISLESLEIDDENCASGVVVVGQYLVNNKDLSSFPYRYFFMRNLKTFLHLPVASSDRSLTGFIESRGVKIYTTFSANGDSVTFSFRSSPLDADEESKHAAVFSELVSLVTKAILTTGSGVDRLVQEASEVDLDFVLKTFGFLIRMNESIKARDFAFRILRYSINEKSDIAACRILTSKVSLILRDHNGMKSIY